MPCEQSKLVLVSDLISVPTDEPHGPFVGVETCLVSDVWMKN